MMRVQQNFNHSWPSKSKSKYIGKEVHNAICGRLGDTSHIPEESVQALFNDLKLFPSKSQVARMLQCARQCSRRNGASDYITFGEFCVFVKEMQSQNPKLTRKTSASKVSNKCPNKCDVFLGGSCNPTTWRADTAIPELKKQGITFYNPQVSFWAPELVAQEYDAKQAASILLFVIDSQTRSTVGMIEVAYLVASGRCVVVVAQPYEMGQSIMGEIITDREYRDLVDGQKTLLNLVKSKGVKIHTSLSTALQCTANILRNSTTNGTSAEEQITYKLRKLREVYDSYGGEMNLYNVLDAFEKLTNKSLEIKKLYNYFNPQNGYITNSSISFERFCALMAEFSTSDGCDMCTTDGRVYYTTLYWKCALLKTRFLLKSFVVRPITSAIVWATQPFQRQCSTNNNTCNFSNPHINCIMEPLNSSADDDSVQNLTDIFLGGSLCSEKRWREQIAIPLIKKHGLVYYNPAMSESGIDEDNGNSCNSVCDCNLDVLEWKRALDRSKVLLMVITNDTRSMTSIILAAFYMGLGKDIVLCVQSLPTEGCVIGNETLTKNAVKDYNRARVYLTDLANRKHVPVFENITEAVECAIERCKRVDGVV
ncbi:NDT-like domain-containing protein raw isoform X4 [Leptinotarsa decemlineata]|uniref:NDT-like domain-containing protein raw isoform X4 n=1 Tax=Leptinotarsa decemlineata TaxID=7539 RepID=UPI003D305E2C